MMPASLTVVPPVSTARRSRRIEARANQVAFAARRQSCAFAAVKNLRTVSPAAPLMIRIVQLCQNVGADQRLRVRQHNAARRRFASRSCRAGQTPPHRRARSLAQRRFSRRKARRAPRRRTMSGCASRKRRRRSHCQSREIQTPEQSAHRQTSRAVAAVLDWPPFCRASVIGRSISTAGRIPPVVHHRQFGWQPFFGHRDRQGGIVKST